MLQISPIPAFTDNYIWLLQLGHNAVVVDPGDAQAVIEVLDKNQLNLSAILITHHHHDHIDGVAELLTRNKVPVYAPAYGRYEFPHIALRDGQSIMLNEINLNLDILWLPGHTLDHIAYYNKDYLFCGDTLFSAGCGRLFEGTPQQMLSSLHKLKSLVASTKVFPTHEYTLHNIDFALTLDPDNYNLQQRKLEVEALRANNLPSLPSSMAIELAINPFLRCTEHAIIKNSEANSTQEVDVFTAIRMLRNNY